MNKFINKKKILLFIFTFFVFTFLSLFIFANGVEAGVLPSCGFFGSACGDWSYDTSACGTSGCNRCQRHQTRLCCDCCFAWLCHSPCAARGKVVNYTRLEGRCVNYTPCNACGDLGSWYNVGCGADSCSPSQMAQRQNVYWTCIAGVCRVNYRCGASSSCRSCNCGSWQNSSCGAYGCADNQRGQVQYCYWSDGSGLCDTNTRCVFHVLALVGRIKVVEMVVLLMR